MAAFTGYLDVGLVLDMVGEAVGTLIFAALEFTGVGLGRSHEIPVFITRATSITKDDCHDLCFANRVLVFVS